MIIVEAMKRLGSYRSINMNILILRTLLFILSFLVNEFKIDYRDGLELKHYQESLREELEKIDHD